MHDLHQKHRLFIKLCSTFTMIIRQLIIVAIKWPLFYLHLHAYAEHKYAVNWNTRRNVVNLLLHLDFPLFKRREGWRETIIIQINKHAEENYLLCLSQRGVDADLRHCLPKLHSHCTDITQTSTRVTLLKGVGEEGSEAEQLKLISTFPTTFNSSLWLWTWP